MQQIPLVDFFRAYYSCRKNKRTTLNALAFELNLEENLIALKETIDNGTYKPTNSIAFVVDQPVKREIFAAHFKDRVVHHLLIQKLNPIFEPSFIYDSYACRKGKGTHFGIKRLDSFIRKCSKNYTKDCYVLKLDIKGFFMHINKVVLFDKIEKLLHKKYMGADKNVYLNLCKTILFHNPVHNAIIKGKRSNWEGLPKDKSLFYASPGCGLPIGNITSQVFANVYMSSFDHFIKHDLGVAYYGRYVDDFVLVHTDKTYLKRCIPLLKSFLKKELDLQLHPKKIYLQHYSKGVAYIGGFIKPNRIYPSKRTNRNFYTTIVNTNKHITDSVKPLTALEKKMCLSKINSYLGILGHFKSYQLRKLFLTEVLTKKVKVCFRFTTSFTKLLKR